MAAVLSQMLPSSPLLISAATQLCEISALIIFSNMDIAAAAKEALRRYELR